MKPILLLFFLFAISLSSYSQDFEFSKPSSAEFKLKKYEKDTSASAVVLKEFGKAYISSQEGNNLVFQYHIRIKIFNNKGFNQGNIVIPIHKQDDRFEKVYDIEAVTFYPDESGLIRESKLDPKQIFTERKSQYVDLIKFAMPSLRDYCIIEYKYTLESPFVFNFHKWEFQSDIPKIYSEYFAQIPAVYNYNVTLRGPYKLSKSTAELCRECFTPGGGAKIDCSDLTYAMSDIPAFIEEDYMTAPENFKSAINFELSEYMDYRGVKHMFTKEWKDVDHELKTEPSFGGQLKKKELFKDQIMPVIAGKSTDLDKAIAIFHYVQKRFKWDNYYGKYSSDGIKKAWEKHTGSVADINLSLITAFNAAGLDAEAVILSTRENGLVNKLFPVLSDFDYVIAKVNIGDQSHLLDATDPLLPFGLLPIRCINDQGRVMSLNKPSYWIDMKAAQKETEVLNLELTLQDDGKIKGKISTISYGYEAYNKRKAIQKFGTVDEYVEDFDNRMPKMKILKSEISNLDSLEKPLSEVYEVEITAYDNIDKDHLLFNPSFLNRISENPFKLAERTYPVDWGAPSETRVLMQLKLPQQFEVINKPESVGLALPDNGGKFRSQIDVENQLLTFQQILQLNKSVYGPNEYHYLKELFNRIIQSQKADVVLRKRL